jgi:glycosyltransferase involved in cell wall biosynthesis
MISHSFYPAIVYGGPIYSAYYALQSVVQRDGVTVDVVTTDANGDEKLNVKTGAQLEMHPGLRITYCREKVTNYLPFVFFINAFLNIRRADLVHIQAIFNFTTPVAIFLSFVLNAPIFLSPRGCLGAWAMGRSRILKKSWLALFVKPFVANITFHVTSEQERAEVLGTFGNAKTVLIANGVSLNEFKDVPISNTRDFVSRFCGETGSDTQDICLPFDLDTGVDVIVSMCRLHPKKGLDVLINAFAHRRKSVPRQLLFIAGPDDGDLARLRKIVQSAGLEEVVFFSGMLSVEKRLEFLANADVFVLPSHNENFGNVYLESLAAGTPVVASIFTPWQQVEEHHCGKWVSNDFASVASAIEEVLRLDGAVAARCKQLANQFSWDEIGGQFVAEYSKALEEG